MWRTYQWHAANMSVNETTECGFNIDPYWYSSISSRAVRDLSRFLTGVLGHFYFRLTSSSVNRQWVQSYTLPPTKIITDTLACTSSMKDLLHTDLDANSLVLPLIKLLKYIVQFSNLLSSTVLPGCTNANQLIADLNLNGSAHLGRRGLRWRSQSNFNQLSLLLTSVRATGP